MDPVSVPLATSCLTWLTQHLPHEFLVFAVFILCLLIGTIIFLLVVITFLLCTWGYVHVFTHLVSAIPRLIKRIARYMLYMPIFRPSPITRPPNDRSQISTGFKTIPPVPVVAKPTPSSPISHVESSRHRQVAKKANSPPRNSQSPQPRVTESRENTLAKYPIPNPPPDSPQIFVRHQDCLYARIHLPLGTNIDDYFLDMPIPPNLATNIRAQVPPIATPFRSPTSPYTESPQSTARS